MFAGVAQHSTVFRPPMAGGEESPRSMFGRVSGESESSGPPSKQRKRAQTHPTPTQKLTCGLLDTYRKTNPSFVYVGAIQNPRRVLTKDARPAGNHGLDNKTCDLILTVGDVLGAATGGHKFRVLDMLGQGTFGQVVKCRAEWDYDRDGSPALSLNSPGTSPASSGLDELRSTRKSPPFPQMVAVKVVKNKPAYYNQAKVEIKVLHKVGEELGPGRNPGDPGYSLIRLLYDFEYHHHLCLVFELMSVNLYELIKHQDFRGLPFARVRSFCEQLLDALECLFKLGVIHCDLKPENILLENFGDPANPKIKLIDLGSACYHDHVAFTYIQSRFYRAPEVLLGVKYSAPIDLWSLGCVAVELYMGLPVFPGVSAHNQLFRIVEMLGSPPNWMIDEGKKGETYFVRLKPGDSVVREPIDLEFDMREDHFTTANSQRWKAAAEEPSHKKHANHVHTHRYGPPPRTDTPQWRLKTAHEWAFENALRDGPEKTKRYVKEKTLPGIILKCEQKRRPKNEPVEALTQQDLDCFIDFCYGLLRLDPNERWTAAEALRHPFIKQTRYEGPFTPSVVTPEPEPEPLSEESEEALLFTSESSRLGDLATDMAEMEMEVDDDEEEEREEETRRIRTRTAPVAIQKPGSSRLSSSSATLGVSSASSFGRSGKSLGLSSSQQRYKRKLSDANMVAASPGTQASSISSVLGSPITRPDVPYPMAYQSRWSDLGLLASPNLGSLNLPYSSLVPPITDQLGAAAMATPGGATRALSYGQSLPTQRSLFLQATQGAAGQDVHAFRRLEFQGAQAAAAASGAPVWSIPNQFSQPSGLHANQGGRRRSSSLANSAILEQLASQQASQLHHQQQMQYQQHQQDHATLSSSWTPGGGMHHPVHEPVNVKKRAESEGGLLHPDLSLFSMQAPPAESALDPTNVLSAQSTENAVVVEKTLEKWAPFVNQEEHQQKSDEETKKSGL